MSAMVRQARSAVLLVAMLPFVSLAIPHAQAQDIQQYLRDQYRGKTFVLRGFPSGDALHYNSSGAPDSASLGDWTTDGFVQVNDIHLSGEQLIIKAQRMAAARVDGQFELRPLERAKSLTSKEKVHVEIKADAGTHNPSPQQIDAVASKIFLTSQDSLGNLVQDYWQSCIRGGVNRTDKKCAFAAEVLAIPGVAASGASDNSELSGSDAGIIDLSSGGSPVGNGIKPPHVTYQHEPEFSEAARAAKYQGTIVLTLVVNKAGSPTNIRITQPLGYGLDANAVKAVEGWKFIPAEKEGEPVPVQIAVEVDFHLY